MVPLTPERAASFVQGHAPALPFLIVFNRLPIAPVEFRLFHCLQSNLPDTRTAPAGATKNLKRTGRALPGGDVPYNYNSCGARKPIRCAQQMTGGDDH